MKVCQFLFPLRDPSETKILYGSDSANPHVHALTVGAFRSTNCPYTLIKGATCEAQTNDHVLIHGSLKKLTKRNQKLRRILA